MPLLPVPTWQGATLQDDPDARLGADGAETATTVLLVLQGTDRGQRIRLTPGFHSLGRSPEADLLIHDERISRVHCRLRIGGGTATLEDCKSRNGTFLNGERISAPTLVPLQSQIRIGHTVLKLVLKSADELQIEEELFRAATTDPLTGLPNRRWFDEQAALVVSHSRRHQGVYAALMLDLDHFKGINDRHGHPTGDAVLVAVAAVLTRQKRAEDLICRFGGEEFLLLLPTTDQAGAERVAERLRSAVAETRISHEGHSLAVTVSVGVGVSAPGEELDGLLARVDAALYEAKRRGRDRVALARPPVVLSD